MPSKASPAPGPLHNPGRPIPGNAGWPADLLAVRQGASHAALLAGIALAARWGSRLSACRLPGEAEAEARHEPTVLALLERPEQAPEDQLDAQAFSRLARVGGVSRADWLYCRGPLANTLRRLGAWHDLAILDRDALGSDDPFEHFGQALLGCRMACLLLPADSDRGGLFPRVAIGWNGSIEATRAIHAALPFLHAAEHVTLIDGTAPRPDDDTEDASPGFDPMAYLSRHGIAVHRRTLRAPAAHVGEALLETTAQARADLLVMGGYSHSPVRERVLGGATRHVLGHAPLAVLMQH